MGQQFEAAPADLTSGGDWGLLDNGIRESTRTVAGGWGGLAAAGRSDKKGKIYQEYAYQESARKVASSRPGTEGGVRLGGNRKLLAGAPQPSTAGL